jgi:hypothetical protein
MKNLKLVVALLVTLVPVVGFAQDSQETVTIPKSSLTDQQKAEYAAAQLKAKSDQYGKWIGIGHEVGVAVNDGLAAVTTQANNFAQTPVGKWTMFVIIFKVIGSSAASYILITLMAFFAVPIWLWSYRKYLPKKYVTKITYGPDNKKQSVEYGYGYGDSGKGGLSAELASNWLIGHWIFIGVWFICIFVIFANA